MSAARPMLRRILAAVAGMAALALLGGAAWSGYEHVASQPLRRVVFAGDLDRLPQPDLEALSQAIQSTPGGVTLASVRAAARRVPWVREASVRRVFPDAVEVTFAAHEALARWNDRQLVSRAGEVFTAEDAQRLPRFRGPEGASRAMAREYGALAAALAPLGDPIAELRLSARGAWQVTLESGLVLELGRGDLRARAERFVAAWPQLAARGVETKYADMRYPNGFAMKATLSPALSLRERNRSPTLSPTLPQGGGSTR